MRGYRWFEIALLVAGFIMASGCHSPASRRTVVTPEPSLSGAVDRDAAVADGRTATTPAQTVSWVDRHPLFSKPRDYWETSGENKVVKAAAATFVGVPVGLYGEVKQIIVGAPVDGRY
jgi:hypothetical protein